VAYGADLPTVKKILVDAALANPLVFDEPAPVALLLDFADDAVRFELRCYVDFGNGLQVRDELHMEIDRVFIERGIEFGLPQLNLNLPRQGRRGRRVLESGSAPVAGEAQGAPDEHPQPDE
jgi:potassium efflux system protein